MGVVIEIRAGVGGAEASLFVRDLFNMYSRYAQTQGWRLEVLDSHPAYGGFREIVFGLEGASVFHELRFEGGVHRVQRVPSTEASGRVHTSAVTVAVLPEAEEVSARVDMKDLRIDVYRASSPGGQHANKTSSAVRITHVPTGIFAQCQDEKSQHRNREKAMRVLRARLNARLVARQRQEVSETRSRQIGAGDRSEKIRTYNFPQNRVTDHRINLSLRKLSAVMKGDLTKLISQCQKKLGT